ncbi:target of Myb1 membrane trafficking protein isoform X5 [Petaurus breviceps papuanus]|uniref:target of Myb1 membrane trafficking protein isoform X5 n=1 Tax=Petaurus breviceps papuanus TaxID=3040969 RepID=UPI0036DDD911
MDFLLGNPFSSPVGQRIERATDGSLQSEDWSLNMEICDIINETEEGPKDALRALKKRIVGNKNFHEVMLALTVLETCVKNCGHRFHVLVASQDFVEGVLVRTILPKNNPPTTVHDKVLMLIQSVYGSEPPPGQNSSVTQSSQRTNSLQQAVPPPNVPSAPDDVPVTPSPEQIAKLRNELEVVNGNVRVMSEMLTELVPGQADPSDLELLQELNRTCRAMQQRVLELIPRVRNERLTEELLIVNDNLNNVFLRHERFERFRAGQHNKVPREGEPATNLIDLGNASPAPKGPQPEAPRTLSSQLAGMNLGASSVSATLDSLNTSGKLEDEFDMFALTRGSSLAEQRKEVKYEAPQAKDGLAGALDARQQSTGAMEGSSEEALSAWMVNQGMIPVTQASLMEDIEQWLSTDVGNEAEASKGVTSEGKFDRFLEERAKAAERLPTLPSPPEGSPGSAPQKKKDRDDDSLFAL